MQKKYKQQGFTIIEVMIVLAIAALIMLIVFLAVPALQRSSRNTAVKEDASRLATAVSSFVSNNNGTLPCTSNNGDASTIFSMAGNLAQLTITGESCTSSAGIPSEGQLVVYTATTSNNVTTAALPSSPGFTTWHANAVGVYEDAKCSGATAVQSLEPNQIALMYPVEEGSNNYTYSCIQAQ